MAEVDGKLPEEMTTFETDTILDRKTSRNSVSYTPYLLLKLARAEPVLLNVYGAPELMPRNEFRQPM
jgi:hypothetical protein